MDTDDKLRAFARAVIESPHNLVSRSARDEVMTRHIPECVAVANQLPPGIRTLVDVGSGGGFPGVVIAILRPEIGVHLVESVGKKARFLADIVRDLSLNATVHHMRVEDFGRLAHRPIPDAVTARAVASMRELAGLVAPLLPVNGLFFAIKGERWKDELEDARAMLVRVRLRVHAQPDDAYEPQLGELPRIITLKKYES